MLLDEAEPSTSDRRGFTCRLADFGMARLAQLQSISTGSFGTVTHMSPGEPAGGSGSGRPWRWQWQWQRVHTAQRAGLLSWR